MGGRRGSKERGGGRSAVGGRWRAGTPPPPSGLAYSIGLSSDEDPVEEKEGDAEISSMRGFSNGGSSSLIGLGSEGAELEADGMAQEKRKRLFVLQSLPGVGKPSSNLIGKTWGSSSNPLEAAGLEVQRGAACSPPACGNAAMGISGISSSRNLLALDLSAGSLWGSRGKQIGEVEPGRGAGIALSGANQQARPQLQFEQQDIQQPEQQVGWQDQQQFGQKDGRQGAQQTVQHSDQQVGRYDGQQAGRGDGQQARRYAGQQVGQLDGSLRGQQIVQLADRRGNQQIGLQDEQQMAGKKVSVTVPLPREGNVVQQSVVADTSAGKEVGKATISYKEITAPMKAKLTYHQPTQKDGRMMATPPIEVSVEGRKAWSLCLVGYVLDKKMPFTTVDYVAKLLWRKWGLTEVIATDNGFYYFKFRDEDGLAHVLEEGPWMFQGRPMFLKRWEAGMILSKEAQKALPLWVKFYNIPLDFWNIEGLSYIVSTVGIPLQMDAMTHRMCNRGGGRMSFARVLVDVNAAQCPPRSVDLAIPSENDEEPKIAEIKVEYQWSPSWCQTCLLFGHSHANCPLVARNVQMNHIGKEDTARTSKDAIPPVRDEWVTNSGRKKKGSKMMLTEAALVSRQGKSNSSVVNANQQRIVSVDANPFEVLEGMDEETQIRGEIVPLEPLTRRPGIEKEEQRVQTMMQHTRISSSNANGDLVLVNKGNMQEASLNVSRKDKGKMVMKETGDQLGGKVVTTMHSSSQGCGKGPPLFSNH